MVRICYQNKNFKLFCINILLLFLQKKNVGQNYIQHSGLFLFHSTENHVQFHVRGNLSDYSANQIKNITETVAEMMGCSPQDVRVEKFSHST